MTEPEARAPWRRWLERWPLLRRLPLVGMVALSAYLFAAAHGESVTLRYVLPEAGAEALRADIRQGGRLYRHVEWRFDGKAPVEKRQQLELPHGSYTVEAQALGSHKPDPRPVPFVVGEDPIEVSVDLR